MLIRFDLVEKIWAQAKRVLCSRHLLAYVRNIEMSLCFIKCSLSSIMFHYFFPYLSLFYLEFHVSPIFLICYYLSFTFHYLSLYVPYLSLFVVIFTICPYFSITLCFTIGSLFVLILPLAPFGGAQIRLWCVPPMLAWC